MTTSGMPPEAEAWILGCLVPARRIIAEAFIEATGQSGANAEVFAGAVIARLARHDPALTVDLLDKEAAS